MRSLPLSVFLRVGVSLSGGIICPPDRVPRQVPMLGNLTPLHIIILRSIRACCIHIQIGYSLLFPRPIWFYIIRYFATGNDPAKAPGFNARWQYPAFRRYIRIITVVWGIVYLVEFPVRVFMVYHLSIQQYLAIGPVVFYGVTFVVIAFTIAYARRMIGRVTLLPLLTR
jgi:hypothetical protein